MEPRAVLGWAGDPRRVQNGARHPRMRVFAALQQQQPPALSGALETQKRPAGRRVMSTGRSGGRHLEALGRGVVVVLHFVLVAADLAVELVHQLVDGGVQILMGLLDEDVAALDV